MPVNFGLLFITCNITTLFGQLTPETQHTCSCVSFLVELLWPLPSRRLIMRLVYYVLSCLISLNKGINIKRKKKSDSE